MNLQVFKQILLYKQIHIIDKINKLTKNISLILFTITNIKFHLRIQTYYIFCQFYAPEILVGVLQILSSPFLMKLLKIASVDQHVLHPSQKTLIKFQIT